MHIHLVEACPGGEMLDVAGAQVVEDHDLMAVGQKPHVQSAEIAGVADAEESHGGLIVARTRCDSVRNSAPRSATAEADCIADITERDRSIAGGLAYCVAKRPQPNQQ